MPHTIPFKDDQMLIEVDRINGNYRGSNLTTKYAPLDKPQHLPDGKFLCPLLFHSGGLGPGSVAGVGTDDLAG